LVHAHHIRGCEISLPSLVKRMRRERLACRSSLYKRGTRGDFPLGVSAMRCPNRMWGDVVHNHGTSAVIRKRAHSSLSRRRDMVEYPISTALPAGVPPG